MILHVCIFGVMLYGNYRGLEYLVTERVLRRNIEDLYSNLYGIAVARRKSEAELQAMYGNRAKASFIDRLDEALTYSGIAFKYNWLTTELCIVILVITNLIVFVTVIIISNFFAAVVSCAVVDSIFVLYINRNRKKNYEEVEGGLISFVNTIDAYSATTSDLVTLLERSINSVDGILREYIIQAIDNARNKGDLSWALSVCEQRVEHPLFKMLIRNLNLASRNTANYSEIIKGCRQRLQEELTNTQKIKAIYSSLRNQMLTLLFMGLFGIYLAANFIANIGVVKLLEDMWRKPIGMLIIVYMAAVLIALIYFAFIRQDRR